MVNASAFRLPEFPSWLCRLCCGVVGMRCNLSLGPSPSFDYVLLILRSQFKNHTLPEAFPDSLPRLVSLSVMCAHSTYIIRISSVMFITLVVT